MATKKNQIRPLTDEQEKKVRQAQRDGRLVILLEDSDLRISFEAAYRLGDDPSNINEIENFLRIKGGENPLRIRLYVLLGDLYIKEGNLTKAKENYQKAIALH